MNWVKHYKWILNSVSNNNSIRLPVKTLNDVIWRRLGVCKVYLWKRIVSYCSVFIFCLPEVLFARIVQISSDKYYVSFRITNDSNIVLVWKIWILFMNPLNTLKFINSKETFTALLFFNMKDSEAVPWRCSVKKVFLKILQNSQENICARVSFSIKLQDSGL